MLTRRGLIAAAVGLALGRAGASIPPLNLGLGFGTANSSPPTTSNPIGTNLAAGGSSNLSYEGFPLFRNRVREGRGFTQVVSMGSPSYTQVAVTADGWPTTDFTCFLFENGAGPMPSWTQGTFSCGFTLPGSNTPTVTTGYGMNGTVSNLTNVSGNSWTFDFAVSGTENFGFQVTNTGGGASNVFAFLPAYNTQTSIDNPMASSAYTTDAINFYKNFAFIRWMWWSNVPYNTAQNTSTTRRTYLNTQTNQGWGNGDQGQGVLCEGYPADWAATFCAACNIGIWYTLPVYEDGTQDSAGSYSTSLLTMLNSVVVPTGQPIYLEIGNELWNGSYSNGFGTGGTLITLAVANGYANSTTGAMQYLGYKLHALATLCRSIFGSAFGTQVKLVLASQASGNGWENFLPACLTYMQSTYGAVSNDLAYLSIAPYINLTDNAGDSSVAAVLADLVAGTPAAIYANNNSEHVSVLARYYGLELVAYESGWQVNSESSGNAYISAAIMDSGMQATMETYWTAMLNAGYVEIANFESGVDPNPDAYAPVDELSNDYATLISDGSPRSLALASYSGGTWTQTRNVISAHGQSIAGNYGPDSSSGANQAFSYGGPVPGNANAAWQLYCTAPGSYSLTVTANGSFDVSVQVNGTVVESSLSLVNGTSSGVSIALVAGFNTIVLQAVSGTSATAVSEITFN